MSRRRFFSRDLQEKLADHISYEDLEPNLERVRRWHPINRGLYWGARTHLPGHLRQARRWPSTAGTVIASGVQARQKKPGDPGYNFGDAEVSNEPRVEYQYRVGKRKYRGRRITIGEKTSGFELEAILARYPVGAAVTVYYDPANPQTAVLERDLPAGVWWAGVGCLQAQWARKIGRARMVTYLIMAEAASATTAAAGRWRVNR